VESARGANGGVEVHEPKSTDFADSYYMYDGEGKLVIILLREEASTLKRFHWSELEWHGNVFGFDTPEVRFVAAQNQGEEISPKRYCGRDDV